jgi:cephalosporin hydroxylase
MPPDRATDLSFCPELQRMAETRRAGTRSGGELQNVPLSSRNNLLVLRNLCMALQPERTLEVGMASGGSALALTSAHRDLGRPPGHQHLAVDPLQLAPNAYDGAGLVALERAGLAGYARLYAGYSSAVLPRLVEEGLRVGLAYVDGSHLVEDVFIDFYYSARLLEEGGVLCFDDCAVPDVRKVIRFIQRNYAAILEPFDLDVHRADGGRDLKYRMARRLGRNQLMAFRKTAQTSRPFKAPFVDF